MSERLATTMLQVEVQGAYIHVEDVLGKSTAHTKATSAQVCDGMLVLMSFGKPIEMYGAGRWNRAWIAPNLASPAAQHSEVKQ